MKKFFLIVLICSSLSAEMLLTYNLPTLGTQNFTKCVYDDYDKNVSSPKWKFFIVPSGSVTIDPINIISLENGYIYDSTKKQCILNPNVPTNPNEEITPFTPDENGLIMGMKENDFHLAMAIYGVALSFLMSIGLIISF